MSKKIEDQAETREQRDKVEEILRLWVKTFSQMKIFSADHENVRGFSEQLFARLKDYLNRYWKLEIGIEEYSFTFSGEILHRDDVINRSLPFLFYKDGMQQLLFFRDLTSIEFGQFMELIRTNAALPAEESDIVSAFWERDFANIRYFAPDEFLENKIGAGMNVPEYTVDTDDLYSGKIELDPEDREVLRRSGGTSDKVLEESPTGETAEGPMEPDAPLSSPVLTENEVNMLHHMLDTSRRTSTDDELIALLYEILYLEKRQESFDRTLTKMRQSLESLLENGHFSRLHETMASLTDLARSNSLTGERRAAFETFLGSLRSESTVAALREHRQKTPIRESEAFLRYLRLLGPVSIPLLGELFDESDFAGLHGILLDILRELGGSAPDKLLDITASDKPALSTAVIGILDSIRQPKLVPLLASFLSYSHPRVRADAIRALGHIEDPGAARILAACLNDAEEDVRILAARHLQPSHDKNVTDRVLTAVRSKDFHKKSRDEKRALLEYLGRIGDPKALEHLTSILPETGKMPRAAMLETALACVDTLAGMRTAAARDALRHGSRHRNRRIKQACRQALKEEGHA